MRRFHNNDNLKRFVLDENIYFSGDQIKQLLNISKYTLSRQLKKVLTIPGCQKERMRAKFICPARKFYQHRNKDHYNLNTVVAIAYRINNKSCQKFLEYYHRVIYGLHLRIAGPNYQIPTPIAAYEFQNYANRFAPHLLTDPLE